MKNKTSKTAKACFKHIGGKLGMLMMECFIEKGWLAKNNPSDKHYIITKKGDREFTKLGVDLALIKSEETEKEAPWVLIR